MKKYHVFGTGRIGSVVWDNHPAAVGAPHTAVLVLLSATIWSALVKMLLGHEQCGQHLTTVP
jgi:hypothetical protein